MDFLHAASAIAPRTRGLSPIRDDGSPVPPNTGVGGTAGGLAEFFGALNPDAPMPPQRVLAEVDPVGAKAYQDAVNALLGPGFAEPTEPDPNAPPAAPGVERQRLYTKLARCNGELDEFGHLLQSGKDPAHPTVFHKGDYGGVLDAFLEGGYDFAKDPRDLFVMPFLKDLATKMGAAGAGAPTGQQLGTVIPIASIEAPGLPGGVLPGQAYGLPNGDLVKWTGTSWIQIDDTGKLVGPYPPHAGAPAVPAAAPAAPAHASGLENDPPHVAPAGASAAFQAHFGSVVWPQLRPDIIRVHGVVGPGVRQAIHDRFLPLGEAAAEAGLIDASGALVGGDGS